MEADWKVGSKLGTETELMARFDVGRSVLREAIRSLERLGVVRMDRGVSGGLTLIEPDPSQVIAMCRRHLRRVKTTAAQADDVAECLRVPRLTAPATGRSLATLFLAIVSKPDAKA